MKPAPFAYWDPPDLPSALDFLSEHGEDSTLLAGGQSLLPLLNMRLVRPDYLLDLTGVDELGRIEEADGGLRLGALCRHAELLQSPLVHERCPLLTRALPHVGHLAIRHRGTLGGSLAHADPAAELPAVAVALDAEITLRSSSAQRTVPAGDFFLTHLTTAIEPGEVLTSVRIPARPEEPTGTAVRELTRRHGDFALVGVAAELSLTGGAIGLARLCAFGVDQVPRRLSEVESLLAGQRPSEELLTQAAMAASEAVQPVSDMHASAAYRRQMCGVLAKRALQAALADAQGAQS